MATTKKPKYFKVCFKETRDYRVTTSKTVNDWAAAVIVATGRKLELGYQDVITRVEDDKGNLQVGACGVHVGAAAMKSLPKAIRLSEGVTLISAYESDPDIYFNGQSCYAGIVDGASQHMTEHDHDSMLIMGWEVSGGRWRFQK